ncbi:tripartite tricarboxylate transporter permease [Desulfovibrio aminophilus]|uniref:tripartite tricarboxylate transporter permease n=1 Tax=Desulfovibrio aminophilus TaxID=81425 RepID=UPI003392579E
MLEIIEGLGSVLAPLNFLIMSAGVLFGLVCGALPGVSGTMAVVLLIPLTYSMDAGGAFILLVATYIGAVFSGSISAILFRVPGAPEAVATTLDGYPMTQQGKAGKALGWSISASALGGVFGTLILIFITPQMAQFALQFGSAEYFALAVAGLSVISVMNRGHELKGLICACFGLFLATVGIDPIVGSNRFTFNITSLMSGVNFIPVVTGMFAISEVMRKIQVEAKVDEKTLAISRQARSALPRFSEWKGRIGLFLRSSGIGTIIGILPGVGATTAAVLSYSEGMRWSKTPEKWGTGIPEGIIAPESANNAAANGALVPLLALGIPGSATTAVMLGAFIIHGIKPGPTLFSDSMPVVYAIFGASLISNLLILLYAPPFIRGFAHLIRVPYKILGPLIMLLSVVGCYAVRNSMADVWTMFACGVLGYVLERFQFPIVSILLGVVLGELAETEFRRALIISSGDYMTFFQRPISAVLLAVSVGAVLLPLVLKLCKRAARCRNAKTAGAAS